MKLLVTGGCGFIGSAVIRKAIAMDANVVNVDALTYAANLDNVKSVERHPNYKFIKLNICDRESLEQVFRDEQPDRVMHLAAESHVDRSIDSPSSFISTNIFGTFNMLQTSLEYWRSGKAPSSFLFHHISTDEVYGSLPEDPEVKFVETTAYQPRSPYSASKAGSDHLVRAWHETYGLPTVITNCSNNYGPYHHPEKLIPSVILKALGGEPIPIYGSGQQIRDWLHVEDHADALLTVVKHAVPGTTYNIGGCNEYTNLQVVTKICDQLDMIYPSVNGSYKDQIIFVADRPGHDARYAIDATQINNELGWKPKILFDEGLRMTIMWFLENREWSHNTLKNFNLNQRLGSL